MIHLFLIKLIFIGNMNYYSYIDIIAFFALILRTSSMAIIEQ